MIYVLEARGVNKVLGTKRNPFTALNEIDIKLARGEFVEVMVPSEHNFVHCHQTIF
ncbi:MULTISPECIES: hypothetical protein [unclassified Bacillus (in: firmicutes)]|uniref:hypothetical protein n=1 Tax=unclassified Bacillus (in: firmicutes) TaxID=185979 RepID=UPI001596E8AC|nr:MULTISPECIES: hypothetical protein [unclassified Bacillus (in: firmicutes)]